MAHPYPGIGLIKLMFCQCKVLATSSTAAMSAHELHSAIACRAECALTECPAPTRSDISVEVVFQGGSVQRFGQMQSIVCRHLLHPS